MSTCDSAIRVHGVPTGAVLEHVAVRHGQRSTTAGLMSTLMRLRIEVVCNVARAAHRKATQLGQ